MESNKIQSFKDLKVWQEAHKLENQLLIAKDIKYLDNNNFDKIMAQMVSVHKLLNAFIRSTRSFNSKFSVRFPESKIQADEQIPNSKFQIPNSGSGFSLMEILLVVAILAIVSTLGFGFFRGFTKNIEIDSTAKIIVSDLRDSRARAMSGEDSRKWGIRFINTSDDYYEFFSTPTDYSDPSRSVKTTVYLAKGVSFSAPGEGLNTDIIFGKITGTTTAATITLASEGRSKTITVTVLGNVY